MDEFNSHVAKKILLELPTSTKIHTQFLILMNVLMISWIDVLSDYTKLHKVMTSSLCSAPLSLTDVLRCFNPSTKEFTWCYSRLTVKSRIDFRRW